MNRKVLHIVDSLSLGGAQTVLKGVFEGQKSNKNIFLFSLRNKNTKIEIEHQNIIRFASRKKYSLAPLFKLRHLIKREEIEIIHTHLFRSHVFGWILKKFFFPKAKFIVHEHGQIFRNNFYYNLLMKIVSKNVNFFIAVSKAAKNVVVQKTNISNDKVVVFYNFVDLKRFDYRLVSEDNSRKFRVGFVGRLDIVKRVDFLIDSFSLLLESCESGECELVLVGDGPEKAALEKKVEELNLNKSVVFAGKQEKVENFLANFDVFVLPSISEACPMSLLEAFAMKTPAIVSGIPQLEEFSENPARSLIFEVNSKMDLVSKLKQVEGKEVNVRERIESAYIFAKQNSVERYIKRLWELYKDI